MLGLLAGLWYILFAPGRDNAGAEKDSVVHRRKRSSKRTGSRMLREIDSSPARCGDRCRRLPVLARPEAPCGQGTAGSYLQPGRPVAADVRVGPRRSGRSLRRFRESTCSADPDQDARLLVAEAGSSKSPAWHPGDASSLFSKGMDSKRVPIYEIANIRTQIIPDFINEDIFIFHDQSRYYAITRWQTPKTCRCRSRTCAGRRAHACFSRISTAG